MMKVRLVGLIVALGLSTPLALADWPTSRGNAQRTGNVDGQPGPKSPRILWVQESTDHYVSAPSPGKGMIYAPALGTLNSGVLSALSTDPAAGAKRVLWSKSQPFLKLPTVCSPAVIGDTIIFGDGMHQNESPTLYCLDAAKGTTIWQMAIPGPLIHLEGTPTVIDGNAYFGAGNGGVMAIDTRKVTLDGKDLEAGEVEKIMKTPAFQQKAQDQGAEADFKGPAALAQYTKEELDRWAKVVKAGNITAGN